MWNCSGKTFTYFYWKPSPISKLPDKADPNPSRSSAAAIEEQMRRGCHPGWQPKPTHKSAHWPSHKFWILFCSKGKKSGRWGGHIVSQTFDLFTNIWFIIVAALLVEEAYTVLVLSNTQMQYIPLFTPQVLFYTPPTITPVFKRERVHKISHSTTPRYFYSSGEFLLTKILMWLSVIDTAEHLSKLIAPI